MPSELFGAIAEATRAAFAHYRATFSGESPYAFGLYVVSEDGLIVSSALATEEATLRRAGEYAWMMGGDARARARVIRWWDADWEHCNDLQAPFARANALLRNGEIRNGETNARELYVEVMAELRADGLFEGHEGLVLGVFGGDRRAVARSIERLNPPETAARFRAECEEADREYASLQR